MPELFAPIPAYSILILASAAVGFSTQILSSDSPDKVKTKTYLFFVFSMLIFATLALTLACVIIVHTPFSNYTGVAPMPFEMYVVMVLHIFVFATLASVLALAWINGVDRVIHTHKSYVIDLINMSRIRHFAKEGADMEPGKDPDPPKPPPPAE